MFSHKGRGHLCHVGGLLVPKQRYGELKIGELKIFDYLMDVASSGISFCFILETIKFVGSDLC